MASLVREVESVAALGGVRGVTMGEDGAVVLRVVVRLVEDLENPEQMAPGHGVAPFEEASELSDLVFSELVGQSGEDYRVPIEVEVVDEFVGVPAVAAVQETRATEGGVDGDVDVVGHRCGSDPSGYEAGTGPPVVRKNDAETVSRVLHVSFRLQMHEVGVEDDNAPGGLDNVVVARVREAGAVDPEVVQVLGLLGHRTNTDN